MRRGSRHGGRTAVLAITTLATPLGFTSSIAQTPGGEPAIDSLAPRVSEVDGAPDSVDVTLFYPSSHGVRGVRLVSNAASILLSDGAHDLRRTDGTGPWRITLRAPRGLRTTYTYLVDPADGEPERQLDPGNPRAVWTSSGQRVSVLELPGALPTPWLRERPESDWQVDSIATPGAEEPAEIWLHLPPGFDPDRERPYPLVIALNRFNFRYAMPTARILDNLVEDGAIPPAILIVVDALGQDSIASFRETGTWLAEEVLPRMQERYNVSSDAADVVLAGASRRGLVAAAVALDFPTDFGNVLSLSGAFYWRPSARDRFEWLTGRYAATPAVPVRFYLAVGSLETFVTETNQGHYPLATTRHLADVLEARGYEHLLEVFPGTHDEVNWSAWLARGLMELLGPADGARPVSPGTVSVPSSDELQPALSPDGSELYFTRRAPGGSFAIHRAERKDDGGWSVPVRLAFSDVYNDQEPHVSLDGNRLYFTSDRPVRADGERNRGRQPWVSVRAEDGWAEPVPLDERLTLVPPDPANQSRFWGQPRGPTEGPDGELYFWAERPDTHGNTDIYRVGRDGNGDLGEPTNLGVPVNSDRYETGMAFAPDGSWLIFGRDEAPGGYGLGDLYIAFREGEGWGRPTNLGPLVNSPGFDSAPAVSPDGQYLYFGSNRSRIDARRPQHDVYVVSIQTVLRSVGR